MAKVHLPKRTLVQKIDKSVDKKANSEVKTYYLTQSELELYRKIPHSKNK